MKDFSSFNPRGREINSKYLVVQSYMVSKMSHFFANIHFKNLESWLKLSST